jgi:hypothetical protein
MALHLEATNGTLQLVPLALKVTLVILATWIGPAGNAP